MPTPTTLLAGANRSCGLGGGTGATSPRGSASGPARPGSTSGGGRALSDGGQARPWPPGAPGGPATAPGAGGFRHPAEHPQSRASTAARMRRGLRRLRAAGTERFEARGAASRTTAERLEAWRGRRAFGAWRGGDKRPHPDRLSPHGTGDRGAPTHRVRWPCCSGPADPRPRGSTRGRRTASRGRPRPRAGGASKLMP